MRELMHFLVQNSNYKLSDLKDMTLIEILDTTDLVNADLERKTG